MGLFGVGSSASSAALVEGCYASSSVPGYVISKAIGLVEFTQKNIAGDAPNLTESIFQALLSLAKERGGNAVVNVRLTTGSYQRQGSQWLVTYVIAYGDAVVLSHV